jgi:hypothetical protein
VGDLIDVSGSQLDDSDSFTPYVIVGVTATTLELQPGQSLQNEGSASDPEDVTITLGYQPVFVAIDVSGVKPVTVTASGTLNVTATNQVFLDSSATFNVGTVTSPGQVRLKSQGAILNADCTPSAASDYSCTTAPALTAVNLRTGDAIIEAGNGSIGTLNDPIFTSPYAPADTLTLRAAGDIYVYNRDAAGTAGDLNLESAYSAGAVGSSGTVHLEADGSIVSPIQTNFTKIDANHIELSAGDARNPSATIGTASQALDVLASADVTALATGSIAITATDLTGNFAVLPVRRIASVIGDVTLIGTSVTNVAAVVDPLSGTPNCSSVDEDCLSNAEIFASRYGNAVVPPGVTPTAVVGNNITLVATDGGIGTAARQLGIESDRAGGCEHAITADCGVLTSSSYDYTFIVQLNRDLYVNTVNVTEPGKTAYITVPNGSIYNGMSSATTSTGAPAYNVDSGSVWLLAGGSIGTPTSSLTTATGQIQTQAQNGSTTIHNTGPVSIQCVPGCGASTTGAGTNSAGITSMGDVNFTSTNAGGGNSAITLTQSIISSTGQVTIDSGQSAGSDNDVEVTAGQSISAAASVTISSGGSVMVAAGASITANGGAVMITAGTAPGSAAASITVTGATITASGSAGAVTATATGAIQLVAGTVVHAATAASLKAGGLIQIDDPTTVTAAGGNVTMSANGGDLLVGPDATIQASASVTGTASGNVTLDQNATVTAQDGNVTLTATAGAITVENTAAVLATNGNLSASAGTGITVITNASLTATGAGSTGNVTGRAGGNILIQQNAQVTAAASLLLSAGLALTVNNQASVTAQDGSATLKAQGGGLTVENSATVSATNGDVTGSATGAITVENTAAMTATSANVTLTAGGDLVVFPNATVTATGTGATGNVTGRAGGNILIQQNAQVTAAASLLLSAGLALTVNNQASVTAQNGNVMLTALAGAITIANTGTVLATNGNVTASAGTSITLNTNATVTAVNGTATGAGNVAASAGSFITVENTSSLTANGGSVTLSATTGAITLTNTATAGASLDVDATAGANVNLQNSAAITAGRNVTVTAGNGAGTGSVLIGYDAATASYNPVSASQAIATSANPTCAGTPACGGTPASILAAGVAAASPGGATGVVTINAGANVEQWGTGSTVASTAISVYGDAFDLDLPGSVITLAGVLTAPAINVYGNTHDDTIDFDETLITGRAAAWGSNVQTPQGQLACAATPTDNPCASGDNRFIVTQLPTMVGYSVGNTLTLDGQSGNNTYDIFTNGSQTTDQTNYVINVLPTGAPGVGTNTLNIYGADNGALNATNPTTGSDYATNDIFLLRSATAIPYQTLPSIYSGTGENAGTGASASPYSAGPAFVAVLETNLATAAPNPANGVTAAGNFPVEMINYDSGVSALNVDGEGGNDYFAVDDNSAITTLDAGTGDGTFQIGQIYGLERTASPSQGNLSESNVFQYAVVATTAGWLSRGTSLPLTALGGVNDTFFVYSNQAAVSLQGGTGNNSFTVQGFALAETDAAGNLVLPAGCTDPSLAGCGPVPITTSGYSTAAETNVKTSGTSNQVTYNLDAPLSVQGGGGFNKLTVLGTPFADTIVITATSIYGEGVSITYSNIQLIIVDGLQGDNTIDVASTAPGTVTEVVGGDGSDTVNVASNVIGSVFARDLNGSSAVINNGVSSNDPAWQDVVAPGVSLSVAQSTMAGGGTNGAVTGSGQGAIVVTEQPNGEFVAQTGVGPIGSVTSYTISLSQAPKPGDTVYVTVSAQETPETDQMAGGDSILLSTSDTPGTSTANSSFYTGRYVGDTYTYLPNRTLVLAFTAANVAQTVYIGAVNTSAAEVTRTLQVSTSVISADPYFNNATVENVPVIEASANSPAIQVTQLAADDATQVQSTQVIEGSATTGQVGYWNISLEQQPASAVTLMISAADGTVTLSSTNTQQFSTMTAATPSTPGVYRITFTPANWNIPVQVTVSATTEYAPMDQHDTAVTIAVLAGSDPTYATKAPNVMLYPQVIPNTTPAVIVDQPVALNLVQCGSTCATPGPGGSYTERLSMAPAAGDTVTIAAITDGQSQAVIGGRVSLAPIGTSSTSDVLTNGNMVETTTDNGEFSGSVTYDVVPATAKTPEVETLTMTDGGSWLDYGFQVGELFQINHTGPLYKIQALTGTTATQVNVLTVTLAGINPTTGAETPESLPFTGTGTTTVSLMEWAAVVSFTAANYYQPVTVPVVADPYFTVPSSAVNYVEFPKEPDLLSNIAGPLVVIGSNAAGISTTLNNALMLPGEQNGPLFGVNPQPPQEQQVTTLNIFDDGAQANGAGIMTAMGLTGFGTSGPLSFPKTAFGAPNSYPGGITWGSFTSVDGGKTFLTSASLTTFDTVNVLLGQGNDTLTIAGTPTPGPVLEDNGVTTGGVTAQGGLTLVQGGGAAKLSVTGVFNSTANTITRDDGLSWAAYEFEVGQEITVNGTPYGTITAINGATLTLSGTTLPVGQNEAATVAVFGPTVETTATVTTTLNTLTLPATETWQSLGFAVGQKITVNGVVVGTITGLVGAVLTESGTTFSLLPKVANETVAVYTPGVDQTAVGGNLITVDGGGGPGPDSTTPPTKTGNFTVSANTISTTDNSDFSTYGFAYGQVLTINGQAEWTIVNVDNGTLTVSGPALPALTGATLEGFAPSPLVVDGDTSQDGVWYSGSLTQQSAENFGSKPFPDTEGDGDPDFIFPVAQPFRYFGNNVINASQEFAAAPAGQTPDFGLSMYGGPGANTLIDSSSRDFVATGTNPHTVVANYSAVTGTQIVADSGLNVNPITRAEAFPTRNSSTFPDADPLSTQGGAIPALIQLTEGLTGVGLPNVPGVTVNAGMANPYPPSLITIDPAEETANTSTDWYTNSDHPSFIVTPEVINGVTTPPTDYANGSTGVNATLYMNGVLYTDEPLAPGTYTVTGTITDFYGNTSPLGTAPKQVVVDAPSTPSTFLAVLVPEVAGQLATSSATVPVSLDIPDAGALDLTTVSVSTDGGATWSSPVPYADSLEVTLPGASGTYNVGVRVTDAAGQVMTDFQTVVLNTQGPALSVYLTPPDSGDGYNLGNTINVLVSNSDVTPIQRTLIELDNNPLTGDVITTDLLSAGVHQLLVSSTDALGYTVTQSVLFHVDPTLPGLIGAIGTAASDGLMTTGEASYLLSLLNGATGPGLLAALTAFDTALLRAGTVISPGELSLLISWAAFLEPASSPPAS